MPNQEYTLEELEALYQKPLVQAYLKAAKDDAAAHWDEDYEDQHLPSHYELLRWRKCQFTFTLYGVPFRGVFGSLDEADGYRHFLGKDEYLPTFRLVCFREGVWAVLGIPVREGNFEIEDEHGWPLRITLTEQEVEIEAHLACFEMECKDESAS